MSPLGPDLDEDQRDLAGMLDDFAQDRDLVLSDDPALVAGLVTELARLGVWTVGTAEAHGGGGADARTTAVALERLGRHWPALGWAAVQAHAAVDILGDDDRFATLVAELHAGTAAVAVADAASAHVRLAWSGDVLAGSVDRVDAASQQPYLVVLADDGTALLVESSVLTYTPLSRTGLGGALTRSAQVDTDAVATLTGVDADAVRARLRLGAAAVAAGIMGAAHDAAHTYAADRQQFGGPLTDIPTVRQALLRQAGRMANALTGAFGSAREPVTTLAAMDEACGAAIEVAASALQCHGGYGYLTEYPAERYLRDAVSLRAAVDVTGAAVTTARTLVGLEPVIALEKDAS
ncbi:acyl-CoA dehydrogenase family protein [Streptomyces sp. NPDC001027]|uniref:acyl-CoA dehydrogenase family protein n=1 Tax=Streptomyces sp. NPDC001027 TaxID=3154771 RepID=UPI00332FE6AF